MKTTNSDLLPALLSYPKNNLLELVVSPTLLSPLPQLMPFFYFAEWLPL